MVTSNVNPASETAYARTATFSPANQFDTIAAIFSVTAP